MPVSENNDCLTERVRLPAMTKSELIALLAVRQDALTREDIDEAVSIMLEQITHALSSGERIEIRGFGSFTLHARQARVGRNPRTGEPVALPVRHVPHFKAGKELRERVQLAA
jgi:integration host factor subunit beta